MAFMNTNYLENAKNCYQKIVALNPKIDLGHSLDHVLRVEQACIQALKEYLPNATAQEIPKDVELRVRLAAILHEVGDFKFNTGFNNRDELLQFNLKEILQGYPNQKAVIEDIILMIDYCSASKWGDRIPQGSATYQLIVRWADRLEATGIVGLIRTLSFAYSKRFDNPPYPFARLQDDYPTSIEELKTVCPKERFDAYSTGQKKSLSALDHFYDKIIHISGDDIPIKSLKNQINAGRSLVVEYILQVSRNKGCFDLDWILNRLDKKIYPLEFQQIIEMKQSKINFLQ